MITKRLQRDASIEGMRIIACAIVIALHTCNWYESGGVIDRSSLMIYSFLQDAVPIFWYIMGMYLFANNKPFISVLTKTIRNVFLPAVGTILLFQVMEPWLQSKVGLLECLRTPQFDSKEVFGGILAWKSSMALSGHLWYVFSYVKVVLWFPVLSLVCKNTPAHNKVRRYLLALALIKLLINDVQVFWVLPIGKIVPFSVIDSSVMFVLIGYELSLAINQIRSFRYSKFIGLALFFLGNLFRYCCTAYLFSSGQKVSHFMHIDNINSIVSSLGAFVFWVSQDLNGKEFSNCILRWARYTFPIYLLHRGVYEKLNTLGV